MIELWQANAAGRYIPERDPHPAPLAPTFTGAGRCLTGDIEADRVVERERPRGRATERPEIGRAADGRPEIARERPDVGPGGAGHVDHREGVVEVGFVPALKRQRMEGGLACRQLGRVAGPGQGVGSPPADLACREGRRQLEVRPKEAGQGGLDRLQGEISRRGVKAITGIDMPIFPKRRFQHGAMPGRNRPVVKPCTPVSMTTLSQTSPISVTHSNTSAVRDGRELSARCRATTAATASTATPARSRAASSTQANQPAWNNRKLRTSAAVVGAGAVAAGSLTARCAG